MELAEIRAHIDALDEEIIALLAKRQGLVQQAGTLKQDANAVRAPDRVEQVIAKVHEAASVAGLDPDVAEATYRAMIGAFIDLEMRQFRRHRARG